MKAPSRRLGWIDALRGTAALLVLVQHACERITPGFRSWTAHNLTLGQFGVTVFFLVSGIVVPVSLERAGSLKGFWRSRFFRLWPAYLLSIIGVFIVHHAGQHAYSAEVRHHVAETYAVNVTMLQAFFGKPNLLGVYWTLAFELAFYAAITVLWLMGLLRRSVEAAVIACLGAIALTAMGRAVGHHVPLGLANLVTMLVGAVMWRYLQGEITARLAWLVFCAGALTCQAVLAIRSYGRGLDTSTPDAATWRSFAAAWALAYLVVGLAVLARGKAWPSWLVHIGLWSYALYLFHPLVFDALGDVSGPWPVVVLVWTAGSLLVAAVVHHVVERPAIVLGRRRFFVVRGSV